MQPSNRTNNEAGQEGFTYIDVMIAVAILLIGVLSLVGAMGAAMTMTTQAQRQVLAKQYATSAIEGIYSARDCSKLGFDSIGNVGDAAIPGGIFVTGPQTIYPTFGPDGIPGTADDSTNAISGQPDQPDPLANGLTRTVQIKDLPDALDSDSLREIDVTVNYSVGGRELTETITTYIANYNRLSN